MGRKEYMEKYNKEYYIKNEDKIKKYKKKYNKEYYIKNKSKIGRYKKGYYTKNKNKAQEYKIKNEDKINKYQKEYKIKNKDRINKHDKEYQKTERGKEVSQNNTRKRRAMKNNIIEDFSNREWISKLELTKGICPECNTYVGIVNLELDHIYPISLAYKDYLRTGIKRVYTIEDVQPLCHNCNSSKGKRF